MSFSDDLQRFAETAGATVDETLRAVTFELFSSVITDTPVDTGRARGNWQCRIDQRPTGTTERTGADAATAEAQAQLGAFGAGHTAWLINNLPYIERLEYGYSKQAPAGMVRKNVARIRQIVAQEARRP
jgi:hypothetical protein